MSWETLAYTDAGIELLMDAVSGKQLTITQAVGGSGLANAAVLHAQTDVTGERHALELLGIKSVEENGSAAKAFLSKGRCFASPPWSSRILVRREADTENPAVLSSVISVVW